MVPDHNLYEAKHTITDPYKHIMIVEDSPDLQLLLSELFKSEGYRCSQALDGRQALDMLSNMSELPSLILLDLMMPVMDGIEFCKTRMSDPRLAAIPVVVMSADSNTHAKTRNLPIAHIVLKPIYDVFKLIDLVEQYRVKK